MVVGERDGQGGKTCPGGVVQHSSTGLGSMFSQKGHIHKGAHTQRGTYTYIIVADRGMTLLTLFS